MPNPPDTEYISVTYPSMIAVMTSIVWSRRRHLLSSSSIPFLAISWTISQTRKWKFHRKYSRLLLVLWQMHLQYMRKKTTENQLSSLILLQLSARAWQDCQSRSDLSGWCHIVASTGWYTWDGSSSPSWGQMGSRWGRLLSFHTGWFIDDLILGSG